MTAIENASLSDTLARHIPMIANACTNPEGVVIADDEADAGQIAVIYNRGDAPPEITITDTAGIVQTVLADGVAVAVVARADGPRLTRDDVLLIERFVAKNG